MSTIGAIISADYPPAEAERGKFTRLDMSTISEYPPSAGDLFNRGRYAEFVYVVNSVETTSSTTTPTSALPLLPNTLWNGTNDYDNTVSTFSFDPPLNHFELYNDSASNAFLMLSSTDYDSLTSYGMKILPASYYSITVEISEITIASDNAGGVKFRTFGHYRS